MIRKATMDDMPRLIQMGRHFIGQTGYQRHIAANDIQMQVLAHHLMTNENTTIFAFERDGELIGMLGCMIFDHPVSGEKIASEVFWWVEPESRGVGFDLLRQFEKWAKAKGAAKMQMGAPAGTTVGKFYERLGFLEVETLYQRDVK